MTRKSQADVKGMFRRAIAAADKLGFDTAEWRLEIGSSTNGVSWKLSSHGGTTPAIRLGGWSNEYLGMTASETYETLYTLALAWEAVADLRERDEEYDHSRSKEDARNADDDDEPSFWFAEGYSVGRYETPAPSLPALGTDERADYYLGVRAGKLALDAIPTSS